MGQKREFHCTGCAGGGCYRKARENFGQKYLGAVEFAQHAKLRLAQEVHRFLKYQNPSG